MISSYIFDACIMHLAKGLKKAGRAEDRTIYYLPALLAPAGVKPTGALTAILGFALAQATVLYCFPFSLSVELRGISYRLLISLSVAGTSILRFGPLNGIPLPDSILLLG
jgi:hypothetical protein